ncbi:hypothetical protein QQS21_010098 [Conoideocrella luteorostrata]|uniref:Uncharacterized protein n=1 Tax=Conoideocrella luteorostrata TaxID=1105319 RepID=A0AAJ0CG03_9HYPO|nr:hypothetical protein QQS21_010098 [Conoideocrella luteorostrata]
MSAKNGDRIGERIGEGLLYDSDLIQEIWRPSNKTYEVNYKMTEPWSFRFPLFNDDGKPKRSYVMLETPLPKLNNREEHGSSGDNSTKVVILDNIFK